MELPKWIDEAASSGAVSTRARHWKPASRQPVEASAVDCVHDAAAIAGVVTSQGFQLDQRVAYKKPARCSPDHDAHPLAKSPTAQTDPASLH
jgi:hypothetical protein